LGISVIAQLTITTRAKAKILAKGHVPTRLPQHSNN
jgi:hypothetical protein